MLSEGRPQEALDELERAIDSARAVGDRDGLVLLAAELKGIGRYRTVYGGRARALDETALAAAAGAGSEHLHARRVPRPLRLPHPSTRRPARQLLRLPLRLVPRLRLLRLRRAARSATWPATGISSARAASRSSAAPSRRSGSSCSSCSPPTAAGSRPPMRVAIGALVVRRRGRRRLLGAAPLRPDADVARRRRRRHRRRLRHASPLRPRATTSCRTRSPSRSPAHRGGRRRDRDSLVVGDRGGDRPRRRGARARAAGDRHGDDLARPPRSP